jgi:hypothetical protein
MKTSKMLMVVLAAALVAAPAAFAKGSGSLSAPSLTVGGPGCDAENEANFCLDWSCVDGAVNYSIEAAVIYCNPPISQGPLTIYFSFSSTTCDAAYPSGANFFVDGTTFAVCDPADPECLTSAPMEPSSVSFKVKGLAVPKGPQGRQNNPFSDWQPAAPDPTICLF